MKRFIGLIGYPLKHSISPDFQQAALDYYGLDISYQAQETESQNVPSAISQLRLPRNLGANITVPYKETVMPLMDEVDGFAAVIGALNTIVNREGRLIGFNTDADGFLRALREKAKFQARDKRALILGAGGAARAVSFALLKEKVSVVVVSNRNTVRADSLVQSMKKYIADNDLQVKVVAVPWQSPELRGATKNAHLIVNCTSIGMRFSPFEQQSPLSEDAIPEGVLVYDLVYNPQETPLLRMAKRKGAIVIGGLPMLVYQGAASLKLWTGREAPIDIMFTVAQKALTRLAR